MISSWFIHRLKTLNYLGQRSKQHHSKKLLDVYLWFEWAQLFRFGSMNVQTWDYWFAWLWEEAGFVFSLKITIGIHLVRFYRLFLNTSQIAQNKAIRTKNNSSIRLKKVCCLKKPEKELKTKLSIALFFWSKFKGVIKRAGSSKNPTK